MKKFGKILALAIAALMVLAMAVPAMAQTVGTAAEGKGSITVRNAAKGETYKVVKLFDATLNEDATGINYSGTIPEDLKDYFEADSIGNITKKSGVDDTALIAAVQAWAKDQEGTEVVSDGSTLTFAGLDYGYYAVTSTQGAVISVDSTMPDVTINDKNSKTVTAGKTVGETTYSIGDTITYTATFDTANWLGEEDNAKQVTKYVISDTLPDFLSNVAITSVQIVPPTGKGNAIDLTSTYSANGFGDNKKINIYWADVIDTDDNGNEVWQSKYPNGSQIIITYTGVLTSDINIDAADTNTVTIKPYVPEERQTGDDDDDDDDDDTGDDDDDDDDDMPYSETWSDEKEIKTYAAALKKTDGSNALAGAKFRFYGLQLEETADGVYTVTSFDKTAYNTEDGATQDESKLGTEVEVNSDGKLYIVGLAKNVTVHGIETQAPEGYNKTEDDIVLTPTETGTKIIKTAGEIKYDAKGNVISETNTTTVVKDTINETVNLDSLDSSAVNVVNNQGTELPSTGGMGTTIIYIVGSILVLGAAILLVTKRRVGTND